MIAADIMHLEIQDFQLNDPLVSHSLDWKSLVWNTEPNAECWILAGSAPVAVAVEFESSDSAACDLMSLSEQLALGSMARWSLFAPEEGNSVQTVAVFGKFDSQGK